MFRFLWILIPASLISRAASAAVLAEVVNVPEPASLAVLAVGTGITVLYRRLRK